MGIKRAEENGVIGGKTVAFLKDNLKTFYSHIKACRQCTIIKNIDLFPDVFRKYLFCFV